MDLFDHSLREQLSAEAPLAEASAEVTIDGQSYGQTPLPPIELEPGTYSVSLTNPDYEDQTSSVTIALGEDTMIRYTAAERVQQPDIIEEQPVIPPFAIQQSAPSIPAMASERGDLHGYVTLDVRVGTDGSVLDAIVLQSVHPMLDNAAKEAARKCKFTPGKQRNIPVKVWMAIPFRFRLHS